MLRFRGMLTRDSLAPRARTGKPPSSLSRWAGFARCGQKTYDSLSRVLTEVQGGNPLGTAGTTVSYSWDAAGNLDGVLPRPTNSPAPGEPLRGRARQVVAQPWRWRWRDGTTSGVLIVMMLACGLAGCTADGSDQMAPRPGQWSGRTVGRVDGVPLCIAWTGPHDQLPTVVTQNGIARGGSALAPVVRSAAWATSVPVRARFDPTGQRVGAIMADFSLVICDLEGALAGRLGPDVYAVDFLSSGDVVVARDSSVECWTAGLGEMKWSRSVGGRWEPEGIRSGRGRVWYWDKDGYVAAVGVDPDHGLLEFDVPATRDVYDDGAGGVLILSFGGNLSRLDLASGNRTEVGIEDWPVEAICEGPDARPYVVCQYLDYDSRRAGSIRVDADLGRVGEAAVERLGVPIRGGLSGFAGVAWRGAPRSFALLDSNGFVVVVSPGSDER